MILIALLGVSALAALIVFLSFWTMLVFTIGVFVGKS